MSSIQLTTGGTMTGQTYNGWTNYETWNVALWLSNDEGTYNLMREMPDENAGLRQVSELAEAIQAFVDEMTPDLGASMFADILGATMDRVDYREIARNILDES